MLKKHKYIINIIIFIVTFILFLSLYNKDKNKINKYKIIEINKININDFEFIEDNKVIIYDINGKIYTLNIDSNEINLLIDNLGSVLNIHAKRFFIAKDIIFFTERGDIYKLSKNNLKIQEIIKLNHLIKTLYMEENQDIFAFCDINDTIKIKDNKPGYINPLNIHEKINYVINIKLNQNLSCFSAFSSKNLILFDFISNKFLLNVNGKTIDYEIENFYFINNCGFLLNKNGDINIYDFDSNISKKLKTVNIINSFLYMNKIYLITNNNNEIYLQEIIFDKHINNIKLKKEILLNTFSFYEKIKYNINIKQDFIKLKINKENVLIYINNKKINKLFFFKLKMIQ
jgi:hypothetical protein